MPEAEAHEAPAEAIPLPDECVDAVFAGQAFHWFDRERALPELHRVIAPGGGLALLWNWWDERDPLQRELGASSSATRATAVPARRSCPASRGSASWGATVVETTEESSPDALVAHLATTSMFVTMDARRARRAARRGARDRRRATATGFAVPRLTYVFAFERLS